MTPVYVVLVEYFMFRMMVISKSDQMYAWPMRNVTYFISMLFFGVFRKFDSGCTRVVPYNGGQSQSRGSGGYGSSVISIAGVVRALKIHR